MGRQPFALTTNVYTVLLIVEGGPITFRIVELGMLTRVGPTEIILTMVDLVHRIPLGYGNFVGMYGFGPVSPIVSQWATSNALLQKCTVWGKIRGHNATLRAQRQCRQTTRTLQQKELLTPAYTRDRVYIRSCFACACFGSAPCTLFNVRQIYMSEGLCLKDT